MEARHLLPLWVEVPIYAGVLVSIAFVSRLADRRRRASPSSGARVGWTVVKVCCLLALGLTIATFLFVPVLV